MKSLTKEEISKHNNPSDCWLIIHNKVYNLTLFLNEHPGGSKILLQYAGKDATKAFDQVHSEDIIEKLLSPSLCMGILEGTSTTATAKKEYSDEPYPTEAIVPPLETVLNLNDFEKNASEIMRPDAWAYYSSASDDEVTFQENQKAFHRIWFRPRILRPVATISTDCSLLGFPSSLPIYITATALGKLGHPSGEVVLTRAAGTRHIIQMIPTLSSCSLEEIFAAKSDDQIQFFQLYVNPNRDITKSLVQKAERLGCKVLFVTVDAPVLGKREKDMRHKFTNKKPVAFKGQMTRDQGAARAISSFIDSNFNWKDLQWLKSITKMPIVLKGIQCGEDAVLAYQYGCAGIVVSNHGGRQLEYARPSIEVLQEVTLYLKHEQVPPTFEVYLDGGIRRGTDIVKALALGAKAVGIGRPFLYAMSVYGQKGVERAIDLLRDELTMSMQLLGVTKLSELRPELLHIRSSL